MPNDLLDAYQQQLAAQGQPADDRDEYFINREVLAPLARANPELLQAYPGFAKEYGAIREEQAPSLAGEAWQDVKGATEELGATATGLGAYVTGSDMLKDWTKELQEEAEENAPTIPSLEDISPGESGPAKYASKDTVRYLVGKAAGAIPSVAEMVGTAAVGAAIGSAAEPGVGTLAGAGEGVIEGMLGRGPIKTAIEKLVAGTIKDDAVKGLTEQGVKDAILSGDQEVANAVTRAAKAIQSGRAQYVTNLANFYGLSVGGAYAETGNRAASAEAGLLGALPGLIPGVSLPTRLIKMLGGEAAAREAVQGATANILKNQILPALGQVASGAATMVPFEAANIVAEKLANGEDVTDLSDSDWKRLREAATTGAMMGAVPGAIDAIRGPSEAAAGPAAEEGEPAQAEEPQPAAPASPVEPLARAQAPVAPAEPAAEAPAVPVAPVPETEHPSTQTVSDLLGQRVTYMGVRGTLDRDEDGALIVDTPTRVVEVEGAGKDDSALAAGLGVQLHRPVEIAGNQVTVGDQPYVLPARPQDAFNLDSHGDLVSLTLQTPDGQERTIRDPGIAYEVGKQIAGRAYQERNPLTQIRPADVLGEGMESSWVDRWLEGFNPYTVQLSDVMDLGDSTLADGARMGSTDEFWRKAGGFQPREIAIARSNIESQIRRAEQSGLKPSTIKSLTEPLYDLYDRLDRFEKEGQARAPVAEEPNRPEPPPAPGAVAAPVGPAPTGPPAAEVGGANLGPGAEGAPAAVVAGPGGAVAQPAGAPAAPAPRPETGAAAPAAPEGSALGAAQPLGPSGITHVEAGFETRGEFDAAYAKDAAHEFNESVEEFALRLHCSAA